MLWSDKKGIVTTIFFIENIIIALMPLNMSIILTNRYIGVTDYMIHCDSTNLKIGNLIDLYPSEYITMSRILNSNTTSPSTPTFNDGQNKQNVELKTYIYYDEMYPSSWCGKDTATSMVKYISKVLNELSISCSIVNADQLREVILNEKPTKSILIFAQDIIPDTIWDGTNNSLIVTWLHGGATIIWTGDWEFYYIGFRNGTYTHRSGIENIPFGKTITASVKSLAPDARASDEAVNIIVSSLGSKYLSSTRTLSTRRPFIEKLIAAFQPEIYGCVKIGNESAVDPGLIKVGDGFFVKVGSTGEPLRAIDRASLITEILLYRFYGIDLNLTQGSQYFDSQDSGIVYILPSGITTSYWNDVYGSRIYFYAYSDIMQYKDKIIQDLTLIAQRYSFIIIMVPLEDTVQFYNNMKQMSIWAVEKKLQVLYVLMPKTRQGHEWDYLSVDSPQHDLLIHDMKYLSNIKGTLGIAVWYGWRERIVNPTEIEDFVESLPQELRDMYCVWVDEPFVEKVVKAGLPDLADRLGLKVVTELYSTTMLALYGSSFKHQIVVTGLNDADTIEHWRTSVMKNINFVLNVSQRDVDKRILGIWIFWDNEVHERFRAYFNGSLVNPLTEPK